MAKAFGVTIVDERLEDVFPAHDSGEGEEASCEALGEAYDIWLRIGLVASEHLTSATKAGHDFVKDDQNAMAL